MNVDICSGLAKQALFHEQLKYYFAFLIVKNLRRLVGEHNANELQQAYECIVRKVGRLYFFHLLRIQELQSLNDKLLGDQRITKTLNGLLLRSVVEFNKLLQKSKVLLSISAISARANLGQFLHENLQEKLCRLLAKLRVSDVHANEFNRVSELIPHHQTISE